MSKVNNKINWNAIKADYEIEKLGFSELGRKYDLNKSTIATRAKKENWQQGCYEREITKVTNTIHDLNERITNEERTRLIPKFDSAIELLRHMNSFVSLAAKINVDVLNELNNETDLKTKVMGLSALKATMPELAKLSGIQKELDPGADSEQKPLQIMLVEKDATDK